MFFDEADALGNRGSLAQVGPGGPGGRGMTPFSTSCHGAAYLAEDTRWMLAKNAMQNQLGDSFVAGAGMNGGGGGGGMGTLQALLTELSGL